MKVWGGVSFFLEVMSSIRTHLMLTNSGGETKGESRRAWGNLAACQQPTIQVPELMHREAEGKVATSARCRECECCRNPTETVIQPAQQAAAGPQRA